MMRGLRPTPREALQAIVTLAWVAVGLAAVLGMIFAIHDLARQ